MGTLAILGGVIVLGIVIYFVWFAAPGATDGRVVLFENSMPGDARQSFPIAIPRSFDQPEGLTYSYTTWILVKDFTKGYGTKRRIFSKGDSPGLYLDSTSNSLMVAVDTYGSTETILIPNIPAMKWVHFALVVDQHSLDIFINGILRKHHTLGQLPQQNDVAVSVGGDWTGVLARLVYYPRSLSPVEVKKLVGEKVPSDLERPVSGPNYFDITWYIGRLYSA
jgi:hypothetical protein